MSDDRFPATRHSVLAALQGDDPAARARAFATLAQGYWKPVYKYVRMKWRLPREAAEDTTQEFFATALEKGFFAGYDPARARFRTYVRVCLDGFVQKRARDAHRIKRGGDVQTLRFDFERVERELGAEASLPLGALEDGASLQAIDDYFDREWKRHLIELTLDALRALAEARGRQVWIEVFQRYQMPAPGAPEPSYAEVAAELGIPVTDVTDHLHAARREFRRIALEKLATLSAGDDELRADAAALGIDL